jgi:hypothetical protein
MITHHWSLSLVGRFQVLTGANAQTVNPDGNAQFPTTKASGAIAGFLRVRYRFLSGKFHPYVHAQFGGGQIRHALDLGAADMGDNPLADAYTAGSYNDPTLTQAQKDAIRAAPQTVCASAKNCVDSIALGYVLLGAGGGIWYDVVKHFGLIFDMTMIGAIGVGSGQSGFNVDIQAGIGAHF